MNSEIQKLVRKFIFPGVMTVFLASTVFAETEEINFENPLEKRWTLEGGSDPLALVKAVDGRLIVFGNGKYRGVTSVQQWQIDPDNAKDAGLLVTIRYKTADRPLIGGNPPAIFDSYMGLQADGKSMPYGVSFQYPKFCNGGMFKIGQGGNEWLATREPYPNSTTKEAFIRIALVRKSGISLTRIESSQDGGTWINLGERKQALPSAVRLRFSASWGRLAIIGVKVDQSGAITSTAVAAKMEKSTENKKNAIPITVAERSVKPVQIDGVADDEVWLRSKPLPLNLLMKNIPPTQTGIAKVAYDEKGILVAFECSESAMKQILASHLTSEGPVWQDDCVQLFIQPDVHGRKANYFQAVLNAIGTKWDAEGKVEGWEGAAKQNPAGWTAEFRIPWQTMGVTTPAPGTVWGLNLTREERPKNELTTWAPVKGFHEADSFGRVIFGPADGMPSGMLRSEDGSHLSILFPENSSKKLAKTEIAWHGDGRFEPVKVEGDSAVATVPSKGKRNLKPIIRLTAEDHEVISIPAFFRRGAVESLSCAIWPAEDYGETIYLSEGGLTHVFVVVGDAEKKKEGYDMSIEVPAWVKILPPATGSAEGYSTYPRVHAVNQDELKINDGTFRRYTYRVDSAPLPMSVEKSPHWQQSVRLFLVAERMPKATEPMQLFASVGREKPGARLEVSLQCLPRIEGKRPTHFPTYTWLHGMQYEATVWPQELEYLKRLGFNGLQEGDRSPESIRLAHDAGFQLLDSSCWAWQASNYAKSHPEERAIKLDGSPDSEGKICAEVLAAADSEAFDEVAKQQVLGFKGDALCWDLEGPGVWSVCFCPRCLNAFRAFAHLPSDQALSPDKIRSTPALSEQWVRFALDQEVRLVARLREAFSRLRPAAKLYINSGQPVNADTKLVGRVDWTKILPYTDAGQFFRYCNSPETTRWTMLKESRKNLELVAAANKPIWAMLCTGYGRIEERMVYSYPDLTTLQMVLFPAIGYKGIHFWWYGTNDARFDRAIARASTIIADFEPFFLDGKEIAVLEKAVTAPPEILVLMREHNGSKMLMLMNFSPDRTVQATVAANCLGTGQTPTDYDTGKPLPAGGVIEIPPLAIRIIHSGTFR